MKLSFVQIVMVVMMAVILVLAVIIALRKNPEIKYQKIEYDRINAATQAIVDSLRLDLRELKAESVVLRLKVDSMKSELPRQRRKLNSISDNLKVLNDAYIHSNYSDSSAQSLIDRLSR